MKKLTLITMVLVTVMLSGCATDDLEDLKAMAEAEQNMAYAFYYEQGVVSGLRAANVPAEEANEMAAVITAKIDWGY